MNQPMSHSEILQRVRECQIGARLTVKWHDQVHSYEWEGTVTSKHPAHVTVLYACGSEYCLPPASNDTHIMAIDIQSGHGLRTLPPLRITTSPIHQDDFSACIFADGGARTKGDAASAAAIVIRLRDGLNNAPVFNPKIADNDVTHARYYPSSTVNQVEFSSIIAALRAALKISGRIIIIIDSKNVYDYMTGTARCQDAKLRPLKEIAMELYRQLANRCVLAHMFRSYGNPADHGVRVALSTATHTGDEDLFPQLIASTRVVRQGPSIQQQRTKDTAMQLHNNDAVTDISSFVASRAFKARSTVPSVCVQEWAVVVKQAITRVLNAATEATQVEACFQFLTLPNQFLPANASTKRVATHLSRGEPFHMTTTNKNTPSAAESLTEKRLAEAVERLAADRKLRSAVKLMQAVSDAPELTFEEKTQVMASKLTPKNSNIPAVNSTPVTNVPAIPPALLRKCLAKTSRQAAPAIDFWSKDHIMAAVNVDPTIEEDLCRFTQLFIENKLPGVIMDAMRLGRGVVIPKPEGGWRPIIVSSLLCKLAGSIALERADLKLSQQQYAMGGKQGDTATVIHQIRHMYDDGMAIVRSDVKNAFNSAPRNLIERCVKARNDATLYKYFHTVYGQRAEVAMYGPQGQVEMLPFEEGVRQGDATSAAFFCMVMDIVIDAVLRKCPYAKVWCYMDDLTVACPPDKIAEVEHVLMTEFANVGLTVNTAKSSVLVAGVCAQGVFQRADSTKYFRVLGGSITTTKEAADFERMKSPTNVIASLKHYDACLFTLRSSSPSSASAAPHACYTTCPSRRPSNRQPLRNGLMIRFVGMYANS